MTFLLSAKNNRVRKRESKAKIMAISGHYLFNVFPKYVAGLPLVISTVIIIIIKAMPRNHRFEYLMLCNYYFIKCLVKLSRKGYIHYAKQEVEF